MTKYFPAEGEPDLEAFGADVYLLCGQFNSNLALLTRTPMINKRMLNGEKASLVNLESNLRKLMSGFSKPGAELDSFLTEMSRMLMDYHDYQSSVRSVVRGENLFAYLCRLSDFCVG